MDTPPGYRLYTAGQITLAAFLGSPVAGFWLASRNFKALGQQREARRALIMGTVLTMGGIGLGFILPEKVPAFFVSIPFVVWTRIQAEMWFGPTLAAHLVADGRLGSWWTSAFVGIVSLVMVLGLVFGLILLAVLAKWDGQ